MSEEHEVERTVTRQDVVATMQAVVDGVASGTLRFDAADGEPVDVDVPDKLEIEVELELEDDEPGAEVEVELEWPAEEVAASAEDPPKQGDEVSMRSNDETSPETQVHEEGSGEGDGENDRKEGRGESVASDPAPLGPAEPRESLARFELYRDRADEWRWRLVHHNGNVIADSGEGYTSKQSAQKGLRSVMSNAPHATVVDESDR